MCPVCLAHQATAMAEWRLNDYEELRELGAGAQGRVVLARRHGTGALVAIKYTYGTGAPAWQPEVQMMMSVRDPYVAQLYDLVEGPEGVAIVMEAVDGVSLREVLRANGTLRPECALVVLKGSLLGLAAAHAVGVVHRDYKP